MRMRPLVALFLAVGACVSKPVSRPSDWIDAPRTEAQQTASPGGEVRPPTVDVGADEGDEADPILVRLHERPAPRAAAPGRSPTTIREPGSPDLFRNTYYDFPTEGSGSKSKALYDASCGKIASVTEEFHDAVCVQGSGRLDSGTTVSFAKRDCECASVCPRTAQKVCYDRLDPHHFPSGRGATGGPIRPLVTVAVDTSVIPLGTVIYVPELVGLPRSDGSRHDGCFVAEDRGIKVVGRQIDVFTGDPRMTTRWNALYPSNRGVHVLMGDPRCGPSRAHVGRAERARL